MSENSGAAEATALNKKGLDVKHLAIFSIAFITPVAPYFIYGSAMQISQGSLAFSYLVAAILLLFTAKSYSLMSRTFPQRGSVAAYAGSGIHPYVGFVTGWTVLLLYILVPALFLKSVASVATVILPGPIWIVLIVVAAFVINMIGAKFSSISALILICITIAIVAVYILVCIIAAGRGTGMGEVVALAAVKSSGISLKTVIIGAGAASLSFLGIEAATFYPKESNKPGNAGKAIYVSILILGLIFFFQSYASALAWPNFTELIGQENALIQIGRKTGALPMVVLYIVAIFISAFTAAIVGLAAAGRLISSLADNWKISTMLLSIRRPGSDTPYVSMALAAVLIVVSAIVFSGNAMMEGLLRFGGTFGFLMINASVIIHFYFKRNSRKIFGSLILPAIGLFFSFFLFISVQPKAFGFGILWMVIGTVVLTVGLAVSHQADPVQGMKNAVAFCRDLINRTKTRGDRKEGRKVSDIGTEAATEVPPEASGLKERIYEPFLPSYAPPEVASPEVPGEQLVLDLPIVPEPLESPVLTETPKVRRVRKVKRGPETLASQEFPEPKESFKPFVPFESEVPVGSMREEKTFDDAIDNFSQLFYGALNQNDSPDDLALEPYSSERDADDFGLD
ncbi:MAG: APC family permease [Clostridiales Family XIII bacterium]|jgi:amino acid transporter|nr:APC family permease [Clostridiales Family XIII bacterium]